MLQSMLVVNLTQLELGLPQGEQVDEHWVNMLGIAVCFSSVFASIGVASLVSRPSLRRRMRLAILLILSLSSILFLLTTLLVEGVLPLPSLQSFQLTLYLLLIPGTSLALASSPITFELAVENCFPVSEVLAKLSNLFYFRESSVAG